MALSNITVQNVFDELSSFTQFNNLSTASKYQVINNACQRISNLYNAKDTPFYLSDTTAVATLITGISLPSYTGNAGKALTVNGTEDGILWSTASEKVYQAYVTQSGTNAPVAQVNKNTTGVTITWAYVGVGTYSATAGESHDWTKWTILMTIASGVNRIIRLANPPATQTSFSVYCWDIATANPQNTNQWNILLINNE